MVGRTVLLRPSTDTHVTSGQPHGRHERDGQQHLHGISPNAMIILMTAYSTTQTTIEAMKFGAFDYIMKPFDQERILSLTESAIAAFEDLDKAGR